MVYLGGGINAVYRMAIVYTSLKGVSMGIAEDEEQNQDQFSL
jgi:hypothetical protein